MISRMIRTTVGCSLILFAAQTQAVTIVATASTETGNAYKVPDKTSFTVGSGSNIVGAAFTAFFADGGHSTGLWVTDDPETGHVRVIDGLHTFDVILNGGTNAAYWILNNGSYSPSIQSVDLIALEINLLPAHSAFDYLPDVAGSPGTGKGGNISRFYPGAPPYPLVTGPAGLSVSGLYRDALHVGDSFYGDLFMTLRLEFSSTETLGRGLGVGPELLFQTYAISAKNTQISAIPEPATYWLLVVGLAVVGSSIRMARKRTL